MTYEYSVPSTDANPSTFVWHTRTVLGPVDEFPQHTLQGGMVYCDGTSYPIYRVHRFHTGYEHVLVVEPRMTRLFEHTPFPHHLINALHPMLLEESDMAYLFGFPI